MTNSKSTSKLKFVVELCIGIRQNELDHFVILIAFQSNIE